ncbi:hypothetical protein SELMODRAFT_428179 [Selaginella moellendorffii]|uniref:Uncharacterized protein n=1 Tax=Selaginella moellendorffii TaxID=88036 RepID=D8T204_SELML|nr:hypothetical protein SELMODRAFT_428179 [Selaginella moellendorffii]
MRPWDWRGGTTLARPDGRLETAIPVGGDQSHSSEERTPRQQQHHHYRRRHTPPQFTALWDLGQYISRGFLYLWKTVGVIQMEIKQGRCNHMGEMRLGTMDKARSSPPVRIGSTRLRKDKYEKPPLTKSRTSRGCTLAEIWKARCARLFEDTDPSARATISKRKKRGWRRRMDVEATNMDLAAHVQERKHVYLPESTEFHIRNFESLELRHHGLEYQFYFVPLVPPPLKILKSSFPVSSMSKSDSMVYRG